MKAWQILYPWLFIPLGRRGRSGVMAVCTLLVVLMGFIRFAIHPDIELSVFYIAPIMVATWYLGLPYALALVFLSLAEWWWIDRLMHPNTAMIWDSLNAVFRVVMFSCAAWVLHALRQTLSRERKLARVDVLTGVYNRRAFYELGNFELRRAHRTRLPLSVIFIDLDNFKQVNDDFGHEKGDELLQRIAHIMRLNTRTTDIVGRIGGDEFAVIVSNSQIQAALRLAQKLWAKVEADLADVGVTVSVGVASYHYPPSRFSELMTQADSLMYQVKARGKNGVQQKVMDDPMSQIPEQHLAMMQENLEDF